MCAKPKMIGISGESGVGKSTIAEIITIFFGTQNTTIISTDDLHKWERLDKNWETFTHLNPNANNLELGDLHTKILSEGQFIYRSIYNHKNGHFDPPSKIEPKKIVIVEGLHAFYTDCSKELFDLKIFIDTDEELRTHWKILRDTEERGYTYNTVLDMINKRKFDNIAVRNAQITFADVIITISPRQKIICLGDKNEKIDLELKFCFFGARIYQDLFNFIENYYVEYSNFIKLSEIIGNDIEMCQNGGGNISIKLSNDCMMIKSSGIAIKDMFKVNGYSLLNYNSIIDVIDKINDEISFVEILDSSILLNKYKRPSMESGFHALLDKYVIHVHPIYLTLLLCMENSQHIIRKLYSDLSYEYIKYMSPGLILYKHIKTLNKTKIYFLENHGIIISSNNMNSLIDQLYDINNRSKKYLEKKSFFKSFNLSFADLEIVKDYTFPDAVIFLNDKNKREILAAHNYINVIGVRLGELRHLKFSDVDFVKKLQSEQHRKLL